jgi:2-polyprenyl-6-methoxyphenol hydroxylase-like FAD-dependent oxidoreductase
MTTHDVAMVAMTFAAGFVGAALGTLLAMAGEWRHRTRVVERLLNDRAEGDGR